MSSHWMEHANPWGVAALPVGLFKWFVESIVEADPGDGRDGECRGSKHPIPGTLECVLNSMIWRSSGKYAGRYIVSNSNIALIRATDTWEGKAKIKVFRSNVTNANTSELLS